MLARAAHGAQINGRYAEEVRFNTLKRRVLLQQRSGPGIAAARVVSRRSACHTTVKGIMPDGGHPSTVDCGHNVARCTPDPALVALRQALAVRGPGSLHNGLNAYAETGWLNRVANCTRQGGLFMLGGTWQFLSSPERNTRWKASSTRGSAVLGMNAPLEQCYAWLCQPEIGGAELQLLYDALDALFDHAAVVAVRAAMPDHFRKHDEVVQYAAVLLLVCWTNCAVTEGETLDVSREKVRLFRESAGGVQGHAANREARTGYHVGAAAAAAGDAAAAAAADGSGGSDDSDDSDGSDGSDEDGDDGDDDAFLALDLQMVRELTAGNSGWRAPVVAWLQHNATCLYNEAQISRPGLRTYAELIVRAEELKTEEHGPRVAMGQALKDPRVVKPYTALSVAALSNMRRTQKKLERLERDRAIGLRGLAAKKLRREERDDDDFDDDFN